MMSDKLSTIHFFPIWLPQTQTWMFNQAYFLPDDFVENHIVCEITQNLDQFWLPNIHSLSQASQARRLWDLGLRKTRLRRHLSFLTTIAKQHQVELLHSHFGDIGWLNRAAAKQGGMKHLVTFYGSDVNRLPQTDPRWLSRYHSLFKDVDGVLCEGHHMADCINKLGCPKEKITVQHLGIRVDEIPFLPRTWDQTGPLRILIAASFREKKGIPYAIDALGAIQRDVPIEISIIGDASNEPGSIEEKKKILSRIEQNNLGKKVRLLGYQTHAKIFEEAYNHHLFLSPSVTASDGDTEGGAPVTIIEMAASGMPIVSTKHCDVPEVVEDGVTGLLAEERDVAGLVVRLRHFIDSPGNWLSMLQAARKHIETNYDAKRQGEKLAGIYKQVTRS